ILGPAMRFIYDYSEPDKINFILPTGQSGYFFSDHYDDMSSKWLEGEYVTININTDDIQEREYDLLKLVKE
ncbi:MAG: penicillin acylase family protein, partial [Bacteroidota bacterium]